MCGITGIFNRNGEPVSPVILRKMSDALAHRGPDGEGFFTDSFIGLGHRRLAIIDLSPAGHQPMISRCGNYALSYNGEIYNFQELRAELEAIGYQFRSKTDSEVVLYSYMEWGVKALHRFNGMFALSIWDKTRQKLFLARDRYGVKPLYYTVCGAVFLWGSEIKALLQHPSYTTEIDKIGLIEYFTFQNFFTDRTLHKNINLLPAGSYAYVELGNTNRIKPIIYWDYNFQEPEVVSDKREYVEELDRLFVQAVNRQLVSDVAVGSYLSGGMDSGSITAVAGMQLPYLKTFTCGFDLHSASGLELAFDEREKAEFMSYVFKTEHYEMVLKAGDMVRCLDTLSWHLEEPRVGQSYPNFYAAQLASKFVKVVLSGAGGDELFGGYPWRYYRAVNNSDFDNYIDKYFNFWQRLLPSSIIIDVFRPLKEEMPEIKSREIFAQVFKNHKHHFSSAEDYVNHSLYFEAKTFLHGLLVVEDKLSMAHSLETRVPFLDNDLVDFATKVPVNMKLGNLKEIVKLNENEPGSKTAKYFDKTKDGKLILRKAMDKYIPKEITENIKQGFSAPDASWFKGDSIEYVKKTLLNKSARLYEFVDYPAISNLIKEHLNGKVNRRLLIWSLINFEKWCQIFL